MNSPPHQHRFTLSDYVEHYRHLGLKFHLPVVDGRPCEHADTCLNEGTTLEIPVRPGLTLVVSDLLSHPAYRMTSLLPSSLVVMFLLAGQSQASLSRGAPLQLHPGDALTLNCDDVLEIDEIYPGRTRFRTVSVIADPAGLEADDPLGTALGRLHGHGMQLRRWTADSHLAALLDASFRPDLPEDLALLWQEGLALQILASALVESDGARPTRRRDLSAERVRLERVRECLLEHPEQPHTLDNLAKLAHMSPSTLRARFQQTYGQSLFAYLRDRRLELARHGIRELGWSIQQAAAYAGYRHQANFATAFKRRYGVPPSRSH